jgi:hypothetical protein
MACTSSNPRITTCTLSIFLHAVVLASANGQSIPKELEEILEKMMDALCMLGAAGPPPAFGDGTGGNARRLSCSDPGAVMERAVTG